MKPAPKPYCPLAEAGYPLWDFVDDLVDFQAILLPLAGPAGVGAQGETPLPFSSSYVKSIKFFGHRIILHQNGPPRGGGLIPGIYGFSIVIHQKNVGAGKDQNACCGPGEFFQIN